MKMTTLLLFTAYLSATAGGLAQKVTLSVKNAPIQKIFREIRKQTGYVFFYDTRILEASQPVSIDIKEASVETALKEVLYLQSLDFSIEKKTITIVQKVLSQKSLEPVVPVPPPAVITGIVRDEKGRPLAGVSVTVKGTKKGTSTKEDGRFSIETNTGTVLEFSYVGYLKSSITISQNNNLTISLKLDESIGSEVVVVGYGTQKKSDLTGSVVRLKMDKTTDLPNYSVLQSIQGRAPGINITTPVRPGDEPGLLIRGINSISASNGPLVVVDGIIYNGNLSDFNASDIETVDILKDASAAAVYGSRSANGVLLITSKSGKSQKPQFNFSTYLGVANPVHLIKVLDGPGYLQKVLDYRAATGLTADPAKIDDYLTVGEVNNLKNGETTDWMDRVIRQAITNNYHLDISGKTNNTNYYISGTYFKQQGIVVNDDFFKTTLNISLKNNITDWYSISVKSIFSSQNQPGLPASIGSAYEQSPYGSLLDQNGPGGYAFYPVGDPLGTNPFLSTLIQSNQTNTSLFGVLSSVLDVPFIPGLKWTMNYSYNLRSDELNQFSDNLSSSAGMVANGIGIKNETKYTDWTLDNIINYRKNFGKGHSIDVTLLYSRDASNLSSSGLRGNDFFTQQLGYNNLGLAAVQQISSNYSDQNNVAYMARINYNYQHKYALTLTTRRDGFSGFAKNNKYATFPSVAFAWTASNENFFKNVSWMNDLKLRVSYGSNGNQAVGRYQSLARMSSDKYVFGSQTINTIYVNSIANNDLTWETTKTANIGLDFEVFNKIINGTVDVYSSETNGILLQRSLPDVTGFNSVWTNIGKVHNHGVEVTLNSHNIKNGNFSWESGLVFSLNRNRIDELTGNGDDIRDGWFIGRPLNSFFGYQTDGIYQLNDSHILPGFAPGEFRIVDNNKDGIINADDRVILGNRLPNYSFSISNTISFKNFGFYMLINSIQGGNGYYLGNNNATRNVNAPFTTFTERFNIQDVPYWTPTRPSNDYPIINYNPPFAHPILEDRSFIRIQDVSISYTLGQKTLDRLKIHSLRLFVSGKNLITFTKWTGYDPENATPITGFPLMRTYTIGCNLSF